MAATDHWTVYIRPNENPAGPGQAITNYVSLNFYPHQGVLVISLSSLLSMDKHKHRRAEWRVCL